jgi:hypothetical protein
LIRPGVVDFPVHRARAFRASSFDAHHLSFSSLVVVRTNFI